MIDIFKVFLPGYLSTLAIHRWFRWTCFRSVCSSGGKWPRRSEWEEEVQRRQQQERLQVGGKHCVRVQQRVWEWETTLHISQLLRLKSNRTALKVGGLSQFAWPCKTKKCQKRNVIQHSKKCAGWDELVLAHSMKNFSSGSEYFCAPVFKLLIICLWAS